MTEEEFEKMTCPEYHSLHWLGVKYNYWVDPDHKACDAFVPVNNSERVFAVLLGILLLGFLIYLFVQSAEPVESVGRKSVQYETKTGETP